MSLRRNFAHVRLVPAIALVASGSSCAVYGNDTSTVDTGTDSYSTYYATTFAVDSRSNDTRSNDTAIDSNVATSFQPIDSGTGAIDSASGDSAIDTGSFYDPLDASYDGILALCSPDAGTTPAGDANACSAPNACFAVVRAGDGCSVVANDIAQRVYVEKRRVSDGSLVGLIAVPTTDSETGTQHALLLSGVQPEGALALSPAGHSLTFVGYHATEGASILTADAAIVANVDSSFTLDTSTTDVGGAGFAAYGAVRDDGNNIWASEGAGVNLLQFGASMGTHSVPIVNPSDVPFELHIFAGQLYSSSPDSPDRTIYAVGAGMPTSAPDGGYVTVTNLAGTSQMYAPTYGYAFFHLASTGTAPDRLYAANMGSGLERWDYVPTLSQWVQTATIDTGIYGHLTGFATSPTSVTLIATTAQGDRILRIVDDSTSDAASAVTTLVSLPTASNGLLSEVYLGVSLLPQ